MGLRGPQPSGKQTATIRLEQHVIDAIRHLAHETGKSQSEVVDMWREAANLLVHWIIKCEDGLIDDTFNGVKSPELSRLIDETIAWGERL